MEQRPVAYRSSDWAAGDIRVRVRTKAERRQACIESADRKVNRIVARVDRARKQRENRRLKRRLKKAA